MTKTEMSAAEAQKGLEAVARMATEIDELRGKVAVLETQLAAERARADTLEGRVADAEARADDAIEAAATAYAEISSISAIISDAERKLRRRPRGPQRPTPEEAPEALKRNVLADIGWNRPEVVQSDEARPN